MDSRNVIRLSKELAAAVMESDEYKNYRSCERELKKNPQMYVIVNELRRHNFELQNTEGIPNMYDEVAMIYDRYAYVRENAAANRFLRAEMSLCRMIQEMTMIIFDDIDFNVEFLD